MLSQAQITDYRRDGYTAYPDFLSPDAVSELLAETEKITQGNAG